MPTEIKGFITDLHITFAYCDGILQIPQNKDIKYFDGSQKVPNYLNVHFITDNNSVISSLRQIESEVVLKGLFVNNKDELIFEVHGVE